MLGNPGRWTVSSMMFEKPQPYPIASGVATIQQSVVELVPETGTTDDLNRIILGSNFTAEIATADTVVILRAGAGYTINIKDGTYISTGDGGDVILSGDAQFIGMHDGTTLLQIAAPAAPGGSLFNFFNFL